MTPEQIEVTTVSATWNPERADKAFADGRHAVSLAFMANPDSLKGVQRVVVDADAWSMHIYRSGEPSDEQMHLWEEVREGAREGAREGTEIYWYDVSELWTNAKSFRDQHGVIESLDVSLHGLIETFQRFIGGKCQDDDALGASYLCFYTDAVIHPLIYDIVNAIALQTHLRMTALQKRAIGDKDIAQ